MKNESGNAGVRDGLVNDAPTSALPFSIKEKSDEKSNSISDQGVPILLHIRQEEQGFARLNKKKEDAGGPASILLLLVERSACGSREVGEWERPDLLAGLDMEEDGLCYDRR